MGYLSVKIDNFFIMGFIIKIHVTIKNETIDFNMDLYSLPAQIQNIAIWKRTV